MIDLRATARGIEFDCLGLKDCCAEHETARCPCARRLLDQPPRGRTRYAAEIRHGTPHPRVVNPPVPTFGDLLADAIRRRRGEA